jgi:hypothetical protein
MRKLVNCDKCGCECFWDTNRNGKRYLAQKAEQEYADGIGTWKMPHYCKATPEEAAEYQAMLQREKDKQEELNAKAISNGEIVYGQTVKVYRGRKVPIGTVGIVFWVADEADRFDTWKIGIKDEAGVKHFLAINNVDYYFDGADELNDKKVAESKAQAKADRAAKKAFIASDDDNEI